MSSCAEFLAPGDNLISNETNLSILPVEGFFLNGITETNKDGIFFSYTIVDAILAVSFNWLIIEFVYSIAANSYTGLVKVAF